MWRAWRIAGGGISTGLANMDPLVPVANRRGLLTTLDRFIARHERHGTPAALLFVDVDGLRRSTTPSAMPPVTRRLIHLTEMMVPASARPTWWRGSAATNSPSCSTMPTSRALRNGGTAGRHGRGCEFCFEGKCLPLSIAIGITRDPDRRFAVAVMDRADEAMYGSERARTPGAFVRRARLALRSLR
jgi:GGDEF domain-containing protein